VNADADKKAAPEVCPPKNEKSQIKNSSIPAIFKHITREE
jgi:hypothetical protein